MDLRQLVSFMRIAEQGSFSQAALVLGIAQSALSRQVRLLEEDLGQALFIRNGRGVSLTPAGRLLLDHGDGILRQVRRAEQEVRDLGGDPSGHIVIGVPPSIGRILAAPLVREFRRRLPQASIGIVEGLTTHVLEWLATGRIDIGLVHETTSSATITIEPLLTEALHAIGLRGAPIAELGSRVTLRELARLPLIIPSKTHVIRRQVETAIVRAGLQMHVEHEIDGVPAILHLVAEGYGFAVLTLNALRSATHDSLYAARIVEPELLSSLSIGMAAKGVRTDVSNRTVDILRALAPLHLKGVAG